MICSKLYPELVFFETDDGRRGKTFRRGSEADMDISELLRVARYQLSITNEELKRLNIRQIYV